MKDKYDDVRKWIKLVFLEHGIKQAEIAKDLKISSQAVHNVVNVVLRGGKPLKNARVYEWIKKKTEVDIEKWIDEVTQCEY